MGIQVVGGETNDLDITGIKLILESSNETELCSADRGYQGRVHAFSQCWTTLTPGKSSIHTEISRVREEDRPAIANEFMELDGTLGGLGFEVYNLTGLVYVQEE